MAITITENDIREIIESWEDFDGDDVSTFFLDEAEALSEVLTNRV